MKIEAAAKVSMGGRANQEDGAVCAVLGKRGLFAAIDGMGGHDGGEVATAIAQRRVGRLIGKRPDAPTLEGAMDDAHKAIIAEAHRLNLSAPGCTATVIWLDQRGAWLGHTGDSRAYRSLPNGSLELLSSDHTPLFPLIRSGQLTEVERMRRYDNNVIAHALGLSNRRVDIAEIEARPPRGFLLCSDGLTDYVHEDIVGWIMSGLWGEKDEFTLYGTWMLRLWDIYKDLMKNNEQIMRGTFEILKRSRQGNRTPEQVAQDLVDAALIWGTRDNVTAVVIRVTP